MTAPALPTRPDLEIVYGQANISYWASADNDEDETKKAARITWAIDRAYDYIVGRLNRRFDITTWVSIPSIIFQLIAKRAGIELYSSPRGLTDGDPATAQLNAMSVEVEARLDQILSGQLQVFDAPQLPIDTPGINNSTAPFMYKRRHCEQLTGEPVVTPWSPFYYG